MDIWEGYDYAFDCVNPGLEEVESLLYADTMFILGIEYRFFMLVSLETNSTFFHIEL